MTHTIEALWNGELAFCEHCGAHDLEANRLVREMEKGREGLWSQLTEAQRGQLQEYIDQMECYTLRMTELAFQDGFRVWVRFLVEGLWEE